MVAADRAATGTRQRPGHSVAADGPLFSPDPNRQLDHLGSTVRVSAKFSFDDDTGAATAEGTPIFLCGSSASQAPSGFDPRPTPIERLAALASSARTAPTRPTSPTAPELPVRDGALAGRVEALRRAQRRQQAGRDRHATDTVARRDSGRQRPAPGRARRATASCLCLQRRRPPGQPGEPHEFTNLSDGTPIVSSPSTGAAITGTVSVVNLTTGQGRDAGDPGRAPADGALPGRRAPCSSPTRTTTACR